eukprot:CAMPEP_0172448426 /NCGR_PEP_ID=MMETSP1065-20121228/7445_1 /TAXON_ID=265537 /ORGANISM="Amphiprora paludosa, Strain CCMP125" /LENGTH=166 /DNA_ID=CAMNT_0013199915 /DNA_START=61 /DNA_END=561 /DNA_ORIENTATION=+
MAPNLKNLALLTDSLSPEIDVLRTKLVLPSVSQKPVAPKHQECESYWDWPTEEPAESVLSLERIESNLIQSAASLAVSNNSACAESDAYWAESTACGPQHHAPPAHEEEIPATYWDEQVHEVDATREQYWDMTCETMTESDPYWSWSHDTPSAAVQEADAYWREAQ